MTASHIEVRDGMGGSENKSYRMEDVLTIKAYYGDDDFGDCVVFVTRHKKFYAVHVYQCSETQMKYEEHEGKATTRTAATDLQARALARKVKEYIAPLRGAAFAMDDDDDDDDAGASNGGDDDDDDSAFGFSASGDGGKKRKKAPVQRTPTMELLGIDETLLSLVRGLLRDIAAFCEAVGQWLCACLYVMHCELKHVSFHSLLPRHNLIFSFSSSSLLFPLLFPLLFTPLLHPSLPPSLTAMCGSAGAAALSWRGPLQRGVLPGSLRRVSRRLCRLRPAQHRR